MVGNNVLLFNQAEMIAAMEPYLGTKVMTAEYMANVEVQSVEQGSDGRGYVKLLKVEGEDRRRFDAEGLNSITLSEMS